MAEQSLAKKIEEATSITLKNKFRLKNRHGRPGGVLDLTKNKSEIIIIGDLHGAAKNLVEITKHNGNDAKIRSGESVMVILGDGFHNDLVGQMKEMASSYRVLQILMDMILTYRDNLIYIKGNHDTFDERLRKSGILQGKEFREYLLAHESEEVVDLLQAFFDSLPYVVLAEGAVITHAGPIRGGVSLEDLINIEDSPDLAYQLVWNRLHEFRGNPSLKEYGEYDIRAMLRMMRLSEDTFFIVGHNPMWNTGNRTGIWRDIIGIKKHIILYCNLDTRAPYLILKNGEIAEHYAIPKTQERMYV